MLTSCMSDAIGCIGGSGDFISCCRGSGVVVDLISRCVGIVGCVSGCEDSTSALGDIGVCVFIDCRVHVGICFIGLHSHSTATGLTYTISGSICLILGCSDLIHLLHHMHEEVVHEVMYFVSGIII